MTNFKYIVALVFCSALATEAAWPCDTITDYFQVQNNCSTTHLKSNSGGSVDGNMQILCSSTVPAFTDCMKQAFSACDANLVQKIDTWIPAYKARMCEGTKLKPQLETLRPSVVKLFDPTLQSQSCLPPADGRPGADPLIDNCASAFVSDDFYQGDIAQKPIAEALTLLSKFGKGIIKCTRHQLKFTTTCDKEERQAVMWYFLVIAVPMGIDISSSDIHADSPASPREAKRVTVAAFGDPHLKVYQTPGITTCSAPGRTKYLENDYLSIYVTNDPAVAGSPATVMSKIEITLRNSAGKTIAEYAAENSLLAPSFKNGLSHVDIEDGYKVEIEQLKDRFVRLSHTGGGGAIVITKYQNVYAAVVGRFSQSLLDDSTGLMVDGCLSTLDRSSLRRKRAVDCVAACGSVAAQYQPTCEYDCTVTGDTGMATAAGNDMTSAEEEAEALDDELSGAASVSALVGLVILALIGVRL